MSNPSHLAIEECFWKNIGRIKEAQSAVINPREMRLAKLLAVGLSNKQLAAILGLDEDTVKYHIKCLGRKLRLTRRGEVAAWFWFKYSVVTAPAPITITDMAALTKEAVTNFTARIVDEGHYFKKPMVLCEK